MNFLDLDFDYKKYLKQRNIQINLIFFIVAIVGISAFYIYKWHTRNVQRVAQKNFSEAIESYKQALALEYSKDFSEKDKQNLWSEVEIAFKTVYLQSKNSTLAPFFLAYEAQSLIKQNKINEAKDTLKKSVSGLPKKSPFYFLYKTTQALIDIDTGNEKDGIQQLNDLINNKSNTFKDMALFYLGEYYWSINELQKARQQFEALKKLDVKSESPWLNLAKNRLQQLQ